VTSLALSDVMRGAPRIFSALSSNVVQQCTVFYSYVNPGPAMPLLRRPAIGMQKSHSAVSITFAVRAINLACLRLAAQRAPHNETGNAQPRRRHGAGKLGLSFYFASPPSDPSLL